MESAVLIKKIEMVDFKGILENMDIEYGDNLTLNLVLGEDLEMDSQEIVEMICEIENLYKIKLNDGFILRTDTIQQVLDKLNHFLLPKKKEASSNEEKNAEDSTYAFSREDSITIKTAYNTMIESIWDLSTWEEKLDHIKSINVLYDDNYNQEFLMSVQNKTHQVHVRSIRRLNNDKTIEFFQPEPPAYLRHHAGKWTFTDLNGQVTVTLEHKWNVNENQIPELYPGISFEEVCNKIQTELMEHAKATLNMWKNILEG